MSNVINKYLSKILEVTSESGDYAYRGQPDAEWPLYSGATRRLIDEHGEELLQDPEFPQIFLNYHRYTLLEPARTRGFGIDSGRPLSDLELLAKLQHFGAKTGLLDFSQSPLVALWFSCQGSLHDGKLFVVSTTDPMTIARISSEAIAQKIEGAFLHSDGEPLLSYWEPPGIGDASARILPQRSAFLIGRPLLTVKDGLITEITIAREDKQLLERELEALDFSQDTLFQDVYGFAQASNLKSVPPLTFEAQLRKGNRHYQKQEYLEAIAAYEQSTKLAPDAGLTYLLRGNAYAATDRHLEAISDYDKAEKYLTKIDHHTRDAVYLNRGNSKSELRDCDGAIQDYTKAIDLNPGLVQGYFNRGNAYQDLYRFEEALLDYDHDIGKSALSACFNKANALLALGRFSEARACYQESIAKDVSRENAESNLAIVDQILALTDGLEFTITAPPLRGVNILHLRIEVSGHPKQMGQESKFLPFVGRIGNTGNTGGPNLWGGKGLEGKAGGLIEITFRE